MNEEATFSDFALEVVYTAAVIVAAYTVIYVGKKSVRATKNVLTTSARKLKKEKP